jgi:putative ABC transport system ATP-binding protein
MIELRSVSRIFLAGSGRVAAVQDIDLTVRQGEWVAITGPSGSGKTTLLNLVAGLDRATKGSVRVLDHHLGTMSERELTKFRGQHLGLVFQDPHLLPGLTATENVAAARLPWGHAADADGAARGLLAQVGLGNRLDFPPARLSGGERQRVGIARALSGTPRLLLADEPTGNLDEEATGQFLDILGDLQRSGLTLLVATHDPLVAARADRVIRLRNGHLAEPATPVHGSPEGDQ